jgi:hypothetical protein
VQKWLGHASLTTTTIYANAVGVDEKDIAKEGVKVSQRFSFAGFMLCCLAGGALYLGLIYPIFRLFDHSHGSGLANSTSGQITNYSNTPGFGPVGYASVKKDCSAYVNLA